jgi:molybdopterin-guanine dinucleotide biosynthesis protein A
VAGRRDRNDPVTLGPLAGLVLCGGTSARMGRDKSFIQVAGEPLVVRVASRISAVADPVMLAPGRAGRLSDLGYPEVADEPPGVGPLGGLIGGLAASPHPLLAAAAVDMPLVSPEVLRLLAGLHQDQDAVVPVTDSGVQPLHAVYAKTALPLLREACSEGRFVLRAVLEGLRVRLVDESEWRRVDPGGRFALNVNRPEDLDGLG